jgi:hypothetical protein
LFERWIVAPSKTYKTFCVCAPIVIQYPVTTSANELLILPHAVTEAAPFRWFRDHEKQSASIFVTVALRKYFVRVFRSKNTKLTVIPWIRSAEQNAQSKRRKQEAGVASGSPYYAIDSEVKTVFEDIPNKNRTLY